MTLFNLSRTLFYSSLGVRGRRLTGVFVEKLSRLNYASSSQKKSKDDTKYKRPSTPYMRFRSDFLIKYHAEKLKINLKDLNKLISEEWNHLDPETKGEYSRICKEELEEFNAPFKKIPRKPLGIYARFVKENFQKIARETPKLEAPETLKTLAKQWKEVSEEEKMILNKELEEDTKRYEKEVVAFEETLSEEELAILKHFAKDKMKKLHQKKLRLLSFPKQPGGAFFLFLNMEKDNFPRREDEDMKEWLKRMGEKWRNMEDEEKEMYLFVKKRAMEKYKEDVENWKIQQHTKV